MVRTIERRVAALEESAGGGGECSYCGDDGRNYELVFVDPPEDGDDEPEELCPECGRQLYITLDWGD